MVLAEQEAITSTQRVKVVVKCKACGQKFILRGTPNKEGTIETGFKMCLCDSTDVEITVID